MNGLGTGPGFMGTDPAATAVARAVFAHALAPSDVPDAPADGCP